MGFWTALISGLRELISWWLFPTATQVGPPIRWQPSVAAPVRWPSPDAAIADSLTRPPKRKLSTIQAFLALGHLGSLGLFKANDDGCGVTARWSTAAGEGR